MRGNLIVGTVVMALGAWAGFRAYGSGAIEAKFQTALAIFLAGQIVFSLWLLHRSKPGSGDRMVLPTVLLGSASMLAIILPRLLWPNAELLHLGASIVGVTVPAVSLIAQIRRRRRHRKTTA